MPLPVHLKLMVCTHLAHILSLVSLAYGDYSLLHAVDEMRVVCPPVAVAGSPTPTQDYTVQIGFDNGMNIDTPHVVSFLRTAGNANRNMTIQFDIQDYYNNTVLPNSSFTLEQGGLQNPSCVCTGSNAGINTTRYGDNYGKTCSAWDAAHCGQLWSQAGVTLGPWCCQSWCYVSSACTDAYVSKAVDGLFFSYVGACATTSIPASASAAPATCQYDFPAGCPCRNVSGTAQFRNSVASFGAHYGSSCKSWDVNWCADKYAPEHLDSWCCDSWCWVDASCPTAIASNVWPGLHWTNKGCQDDPVLVASCPFKATTRDSSQSQVVGGTVTTTTTPDPACNCIGYSPILLRSGRRRAGRPFPSKYGATCSAWDAQWCAQYFPLSKPDIWCCQSWCYVDEDCGSSNPSLVIPGYFWSYDACQDDGSTLGACNFSSVCRPTGSNSGMSQEQLNNFGTAYGTSCDAWDANNCTTWWRASEFWQQGGNDWCCDSWAYVDQRCPIAEQSNESASLFYAYEVCQDNANTSVYNEATQECVAASSTGSRRLRGDARRLAARRRSGSFGGGSSRRRSSWSRPSSTPSRRRAAVPSYRRRAPVVPTPRRRAPTPRRRDPRRRSPGTPAVWPRPAPPPTPRRRVPTPRPTPPPRPTPRPTRSKTEGRRRQMIGGGQYEQRRRVPVSMPVSPRRRGFAAPPPRPVGQQVVYGYNTKNNLQQSYYGNMPQHTSYGYTGPGVKKNSMVPVMMAGAAGVAGGVLLAGGAYMGSRYVAQRLSENGFGGSPTDVSWCRVPSGQGANSDRMIRCSDCQQKYGPSCQSLNDCFNPNGCLFNITSASTRQDVLIPTGFIPGNYEPPLKLRITKISGPDITQSNVCPVPQPNSNSFNAQWEAASSFDVNLFVTLKQVSEEVIPTAKLGKTSGSICNNLPFVSIVMCFCLLAMKRDI